VFSPGLTVRLNTVEIEKQSQTEKNVVVSSLLGVTQLIGDILASEDLSEVNLEMMGKFTSNFKEVKFVPFSRKPSKKLSSMAKATVKTILELSHMEGSLGLHGNYLSTNEPSIHSFSRIDDNLPHLLGKNQDTSPKQDSRGGTILGPRSRLRMSPLKINQFKRRNKDM